jgi:minichromosome maintenance protein 10
MAGNMEEEDDDEEDEETLQLQLQAIQAKLKLKKLQNKREAETAERRTIPGNARAQSPRKVVPPASPRKRYEAEVEVPTSPVRTLRPPEEQMSPARRKLGLTVIPRAEDISLKRARDGSVLKRSNSAKSTATVQTPQPRPLSFNERLALQKDKEEEKQAKQERLQRLRNAGFDLGRAGASLGEPLSQQTPARSVRATAEAAKRPSSAGRTPGVGHEKKATSRTSHRDVNSRETRRESSRSAAVTGNDVDEINTSSPDISRESSEPDSGYDPFSKIHLKKRLIQHQVIAREMEGKEIYTLPRLLKEVKSPEYEPPDCESDYVVFAVLASKSTPFDHAQTHKTVDSHAKDNVDVPRNKFMVLKLCDLKWEVDCFLFGTAFNQFWKLTPGTLLAILNPAIMPPKGNQHSGKFSLKLGSSEDAVMEIGVARDLGYCISIKKDGQPCGDWVDKRKTEACEFHISLQIDKARKHRMEVNTMFRDPDGNKDDRTKSRLARENKGKNTGPGKYHRDYGTLYSVPGVRGGRSAATLLDADNTDALHNMTQEEASRKRIANAQKERDLAKQLGDIGDGVGADYLRATKYSMTSTVTTTTSSSSRSEAAAEAARKELFSKPSAAELGLLSRKPEDLHLSPPKNRKSHFGLGPLAHAKHGTKNDTPMGWGGAKKWGLLQPPAGGLAEPEKGQTKLSAPKSGDVRPRSQDSSLRSAGSRSPVKKRARLQVPFKGIREPGRESLPGGGFDADDDDDDDLEIV